MTKLEKIIYGIIGVCVLALIIMLSSCSNKAQAWQLWDVAEHLNHLQDMKQECYDNLTYAESVKAIQGKEQFCTQYDDEILKTREVYDRLTHHDYMGLR